MHRFSVPYVDNDIEMVIQVSNELEHMLWSKLRSFGFTYDEEHQCLTDNIWSIKLTVPLPIIPDLRSLADCKLRKRFSYRKRSDLPSYLTLGRNKVVNDNGFDKLSIFENVLLDKASERVMTSMRGNCNFPPYRRKLTLKKWCEPARTWSIYFILRFPVQTTSGSRA